MSNVNTPQIPMHTKDHLFSNNVHVTSYTEYINIQLVITWYYQGRLRHTQGVVYEQRVAY